MVGLMLLGCTRGFVETAPEDLEGVTLSEGEDGFRLVVEGLFSQEEVRLIGSAWDDVWIRGCTVSGSPDDGIFLRDVRHVRISGCSIERIGGQGGIRLSVSGGTEGVELLDNALRDLALNGINVPQRSDEGIDHPGLIVRGNRIERAGLEGRGGLHHGMYVQSSGFVIEDNVVVDTHDGNGISVRSHGIVRGNAVYGYGQTGIRYYDDHDGAGGTLVVENNLVGGEGTGISLLKSEVDPSFTVDGWVLRHNTVVSTEAPAIARDPAFPDTLALEATGNLLLSETPTEGLPLGRNVIGAVDQFLSLDPNAPDLHLVGPHPERGAVDGGEAPAWDVDGDPRPASGRDPGADQVL